MKSRTLRLGIQWCSQPADGYHWYIFSASDTCPNGIPARFAEYKEAREYALRFAYARNINTYE